MKKIPFVKYHGTANDFIIINHLDKKIIDLNDHDLIRNMCSRRFGIGADGLMVLERSTDNLDFKMHYYNADGSPSSMCGNGGRCISYAFILAGLRQSAGPKVLRFDFNGDVYEAEYLESQQWISLKMQDLSTIQNVEGSYILDTGSPHYVQFYKEIRHINVFAEGARIRNSPKYKLDGINVNFCSFIDDVLHVRTYERGVEDETFSCGTGVVASAIAYTEKENFGNGLHEVAISTLGGELSVKFNKLDGQYSNIYLQGPAVKVFEGEFLSGTE